MRYILFDTETTGLSRTYGNYDTPLSVRSLGSEVLQIGGLFLSEEDFLPVKAFSYYCDILTEDSDAKAKETHGIDVSEIRRHLPNIYFDEIMLKRLPEFFEQDVLFIGYNIKFDLDMVQQSLRGSPTRFEECVSAGVNIPTSGRRYLDILSCLPKRRALSTFSKEITAERYSFNERVLSNIPRVTNAYWRETSFCESNHDALYDSIEAYLVFMKYIWGKRVFRRR